MQKILYDPSLTLSTKLAPRGCAATETRIRGGDAENTESGISKFEFRIFLCALCASVMSSLLGLIKSAQAAKTLRIDSTKLAN